jgi:hypothetical protein
VLVAAAAGLCGLFGSAGGSGAADASRTCGARGRSYVVVEDERVSRGITATLISVVQPQIGDGLVAAWVGVGGPGQGRHGQDAWIQVGLSVFTGGMTALYFEIKRPRIDPEYTEIQRDVSVDTRFRIGVREDAARPGWWRVWVNGTPVSAAVDLPGSSGRWRPTATAETWRDEPNECYRFAFRFERVAIATSRSRWAPLVPGERYRDPGYRLRFLTRSTFLVSSP